jgi:hypothetical protein
MEVAMKSAKTLYCSFCGRSQHEVAKLIAGPSANICDDCAILSVATALDLSEELLREHVLKLTVKPPTGLVIDGSFRVVSPAH